MMNNIRICTFNKLIKKSIDPDKRFFMRNIEIIVTKAYVVGVLKNRCLVVKKYTLYLNACNSYTNDTCIMNFSVICVVIKC